MNTSISKMITFLIIVLSLQACNKQAEQVIEDDSKILATVGNYQITEAYLDAYLISNDLPQASEQQKKQGLDSIVNQLSLAHQANKDGLKLTQQQAFEIEQAKQLALAQLAVDAHMAKNPVTDADIQAEYQRITTELKGEEYHVRHLLYKDEVEALEVLDKINAGRSYAELEAEYLLTNSRVKNVGDIGWVNIMQVPEVFRVPLQSMQPTSIYPKTLVSQYGVHVLYLENKRPLIAPEFNTVKAGIRETLKQQKISRYQQLAVIKAKAKLIK